MPQSSWMGHGTQSLGHWVACLVFWRNNSASSPAFASLRQLSQLLLVMLTVMFLVQKHLIWIARQWLHSTFYRFSLCFVSVWPFFRVGAESRWLWGWEVDGAEQTHLLSCICVQLRALGHSKGQPLLPCCQPGSQRQDRPQDSCSCHCRGAAAEQEEMSLSRHKSIACVFILSFSFKWKTIWTVSEDEGYKSVCCYLYRARHCKCLNA